MRTYTRTRLSLAAGVTLLVAALAGATTAPVAIAARSDERILTKAQQAAALEGMRPAERERLGKLWSDPTQALPVAYTRAFFNVVPDGHGGERLERVGGYDVTPEESALVLPSTLMAGTGTGGAYDLYMSVATWRTGYSGYEWGIETYADWRNGTSGAGSGCNTKEDSIATSWAGNLVANRDDGGSGKYIVLKDAVDIYRSDVTPNEGVGWSFHEWEGLGTGSCQIAEWVRAAVYIRESSWKGRADNVAGFYVHSKGSSSFSLAFANASVTVSPSGDTWKAAAYTTFNH